METYQTKAKLSLTCDVGSKVFLADDSWSDSSFLIKVDFLVLNINPQGSLEHLVNRYKSRKNCKRMVGKSALLAIATDSVVIEQLWVTCARRVIRSRVVIGAARARDTSSSQTSEALDVM